MGNYVQGEVDSDFWEEEACDLVRAEMDAATFDFEKKEVVLGDILCGSYDDLHDALYDLAVSKYQELVPYCDGDPISEFDATRIDEILQDEYSSQLEDLGWEQK